jgi:hypothetical protein
MRRLIRVGRTLAIIVAMTSFGSHSQAAILKQKNGHVYFDIRSNTDGSQISIMKCTPLSSGRKMCDDWGVHDTAQLQSTSRKLFLKAGGVGATELALVLTVAVAVGYAAFAKVAASATAPTSIPNLFVFFFEAWHAIGLGTAGFIAGGATVYGADAIAQMLSDSYKGFRTVVTPQGIWEQRKALNQAIDQSLLKEELVIEIGDLAKFEHDLNEALVAAMK